MGSIVDGTRVASNFGMRGTRTPMPAFPSPNLNWNGYSNSVKTQAMYKGAGLYGGMTNAISKTVKTTMSSPTALKTTVKSVVPKTPAFKKPETTGINRSASPGLR